MSDREGLISYYNECTRRVGNRQAADFLRARGISIKTAARCHVGFDPNADTLNTGFKSPRIILPTSRTHYFAVSVSKDTSPRYAVLYPRNSHVGIFNSTALYPAEPKPVLITENPFDALCVEEAGYPAISINSGWNTHLLLKYMELRFTTASVFVLLLNETRDKRHASPMLEEAANDMYFPILRVALPSSSYATVSDWAGSDPKGFASALRTFNEDAIEHAANSAPSCGKAREDRIERHKLAFWTPSLAEYITDNHLFLSSNLPLSPLPTEDAEDQYLPGVASESLRAQIAQIEDPAMRTALAGAFGLKDMLAPAPERHESFGSTP